jgi:hypothetical protein
MTSASDSGRTDADGNYDTIERDYADTSSDRVTYAATTPRYVPQAVGRDRVRWGPILAGLLTALSSFIVLSLLATVLGLQAIDSNTTNAQNAGQTGAIIAAILGLVSFFLGGLVAAWTAGLRNPADGALNGFLVWALAVPLMLLVAGLGLGQVFGAAGDLFGNYRNLSGAAADVDRNAVVDAIRNGALGALLGLILPAIASTLGGWFGARRDASELAEPAGYRMERA